MADKYGPISIQRHLELQRQGVHLHVYYQNEDVTRRCSFADDTGAGRARLFKLNEQGEPYIEPGKNVVATEWVEGVEIREGTPFGSSDA